MTIEYLYHSGFLITFSDCQVLIDYWNPKKHGLAPLLKTDRPLYILVSHQHPDHFDKSIFTIEHPQKIYILSDLCTPPSKEIDVHYVHETSTYKDTCLSITCYGSTDEGVSFYIQHKEYSFFHAGDLNNWHWNEDRETTKEESLAFESHYYKELEKIAKDIKEIDFLFFPIDIRLGTDYMKGATKFLEKIKVSHFIPMHFQEQFDKANAFEGIAIKNNVTFIPIYKDNEVIYKEANND